MGILLGALVPSAVAQACSDATKAPTGNHVVYNLSVTTPDTACNVSAFGTKVLDSCCTATGTFNMLGSSFQQFYVAAGNSSCVTVMETPEGAMKAKMQCNEDNTVTYAEDCSATCSCESGSTITKAPGCYKANDMPGTMWFVKIEGCECTAGGDSLTNMSATTTESAPATTTEGTSKQGTSGAHHAASAMSAVVMGWLCLA